MLHVGVIFWLGQNCKGGNTALHDTNTGTKAPAPYNIHTMMIAKPSSAPASNTRAARGCGFTRLYLPLVAVLAAGWGGGTVAAAASAVGPLAPDPFQCDESACADIDYSASVWGHCFVLVGFAPGERIICDDEQFRHPVLVGRPGFNEQLIQFTCC